MQNIQGIALCVYTAYASAQCAGLGCCKHKCITVVVHTDSCLCKQQIRMPDATAMAL